MMDFKYTLKQEELKDYYATSLLYDAEVNKFHWKLRLFVPAGILLFLALAAKTIMIWAIGLALIILWIIIADKVLFAKYKKVLIDKYTDPTRLKLTEMHVVLSDKGLYLNGDKQEIYDYALYENLVVVILQNKANILIPLRLFDSKDKFDELVKNIESFCPLYASKGGDHES